MAGGGSVVLMSGGIESAVLLYHWRSSSALLQPLYVNYGQRGAAMEEQASDKICTQLGLHLNRIDMSVVGEQFRALQQQAKSFVPLPHRNLVILGLAASYATQVGSNVVALGLNKEDLGSYSSASQTFLDSFRSTAASLQPPVTLLTPLSHLTKAEVISLGRSLGAPSGRSLVSGLTLTVAWLADLSTVAVVISADQGNWLLLQRQSRSLLDFMRSDSNI